MPVQAADEYWNDLRSLPFPENYPTQESADRLYDEMLFQRASQVVIWSLPATALWAMKKGSEAQFGEGSNVFPVWKDRLSAETIVSTPNSDVIYGMGYLDLQKDGPTVIEVPPKLQGILDDFWHRPLTEFPMPVTRTRAAPRCWPRTGPTRILIRRNQRFTTYV